MPTAHWLGKDEALMVDASLCGGKVAGLARLPSSWTPRFVVLTTTGVAAFAGNGAERRTRPLPRSAALRALMAESPQGLFVRSSSTDETLETRGQLDSERCRATWPELRECIDRLLTRLAPSVRPSSLALIVQTYYEATTTGHLSNERRVSADGRRWLIEAEVEMPERHVSFWTNSTAATTTSLDCVDPVDLTPALRYVAKELVRERDRRFHLEWVWTGRRLLITQADCETTSNGPLPGDTPESLRARPVERVRTEAFRTVPTAPTPWSKLEHVQTFAACRLPVADFYVLAGEHELEAVSRGRLRRVVYDDLVRLCAHPLVIRTDVADVAPEERLMLPRTDACTDPDEALSFISRTTRELTERGAPLSGIAFIAHHFIPARAGAFSQATPDTSLVRIDSSWGFPDSLLYYPHDSFEVDGDGALVSRQLRCKSQYMAVDASGAWKPRTCPAPWDWRASISEDERVEIARISLQLARHLGRPVEIMFFVGVMTSSTSIPALPWFYIEDSPRLDPLTTSQRASYYAGDRVTLRSEEDVQELERHLHTGIVSGSRPSIRLRPRFELLRSPEFISQVIRLARSWDCAVELEGSLLTHAYYLIAAAGVRVRVVDPFLLGRRQVEFAKLVRDLIPVRIEAAGELPYVYRATREELLPLLQEKIVEEAIELHHEHDRDRLLGELADLYDLVSTIARLIDVDMGAVQAESRRKRAELGGFEEGIVLVDTRRAHEQRARRDHGGAERLRGRTDATRPRAPRPRVGPSTLTLPVVPPRGETTFRVGLPQDPDREIAIYYRGFEVVLEYQRPRAQPAVRQMSFDEVAGRDP